MSLALTLVVCDVLRIDGIRAQTRRSSVGGIEFEFIRVCEDVVTLLEDISDVLCWESAKGRTLPVSIDVEFECQTMKGSGRLISVGPAEVVLKTEAELPSDATVRLFLHVQNALIPIEIVGVTDTAERDRIRIALIETCQEYCDFCEDLTLCDGHGVNPYEKGCDRSS